MQYINKFLNFIKSIFKKQEKIPNIVNEKIILEKEVPQIILQDINIGDIIWAKRYQDEAEKESIKEGHQEGPFIVLGRTNQYLICSTGTSVEPDENRLEKYFDLMNKGYKLTKETYFKLFFLVKIDDYSFIKKLDTLKEQDKIKLFKKLKQRNLNRYNLNGEWIYFKLPLYSGDIIKNKDKKYIIIDVKENQLFCVPLNTSYKKLKYNLQFKYFKNLDYSKLVCIDDSGKFKTINSVEDNVLLYVLKKQKEYIEYCENQKIPQRGSVILKNNEYYYIYGEESQKWLSFRIYKNCVDVCDNIIINNKKFCTKYEDIVLDKNENFKTVSLAQPIEMDNIKAKRKSYKKTKESEKEYKNFFDIGDIVEYESINEERYIIIKKNKKTYDCLSIKEIKKGIYNPVLLLKKYVKESKNKSIDGIVWLEKNKEFNMRYINQKENTDKIFKEQYINNMKLEDNNSKEKVYINRYINT